MRSHLLLLTTILVLCFSACKKDDNDSNSELDKQLETALEAASGGKGLSHFTFPASSDYDAIPQDPKNPITKEKVELGKLLFHETGIALAPKMDIGKGTFSCATCHFASAGFQAGRFQGIADGGIGFGINGEGRRKGSLYNPDSLDVQPVKTPSAMNGAYQKNMLWNGQFGGTGVNVGTEANWPVGTPIENNKLGYEGLEIQAIAGLGVHRLVMDTAFLAANNYITLFDQAFPDINQQERYTTEFAGLAIAAYERTILANQAPFQEWLKGDEQAMTEQEKRGALVFFEKANCNNCHTGPALNSMEFHAIGMYDLHDCPEEIFQAGPDKGENRGRGGFTKNPADNYKFKVPQLYNLSDSPFFGHGSSLRSIREVIEYKNNAVAENSDVDQGQLSADFVPLNLTEQDIEDITAFISQGLRDPSLARYQPMSLPSGQCTPSHDPMSRADLGCD